MIKSPFEAVPQFIWYVQGDTFTTDNASCEETSDIVLAVYVPTAVGLVHDISTSICLISVVV